jgi:hypothetical protein
MLRIKILRGQGLSLQEIATELNIPLAAVENAFLSHSDAKRRGQAFMKVREEMGIKQPACVGKKRSIVARLQSNEASKAYWDKPENHSKKRHQPPRGKYKGVAKRYNSDKWEAKISVDGKVKCLGSFKTELEAAIAYNAGVDLYYGGDGYKNIIEVPSDS